MDDIATANRLLDEIELVRHQYKDDLPKLIELSDYKIALKVVIAMGGGPLPRKPIFFAYRLPRHRPRLKREKARPPKRAGFDSGA